MVLHLAAITKLKLLATAGHGHGPAQLLAGVLGTFMFKLAFGRYAPRTLGDLVFSSRLFLFRLSRIFLRGPLAATADRGRWRRALRLLFGSTDGRRQLPMPPPDAGSLQAISMVVL